MTGRPAVKLSFSGDAAELSPSEEYSAMSLAGQDERSKKAHGVPLLYAGAVILRFAEKDLRINAPALLIPAALERNRDGAARVLPVSTKPS
jgi:hypothetical protein